MTYIIHMYDDLWHTSGDALGLSPKFVEKMQLVALAAGKMQAVTDLEVLAVLGRVGLSQADIIFLVTVSALMLIAIFIFLFLGMALFTEGIASDAQAVINSMITAGSAVAFNANSQSGGGSKLMDLLNKAMEYVKKMQGVGEFSFDVDEDFAGMLSRASDFQSKKAKEDREKKKKGKQGEEKKGQEKKEQAEEDGQKIKGPSNKEAKKGKRSAKAQASGPSIIFCNERLKLKKVIIISTTTMDGKVLTQRVEAGLRSDPFCECVAGQVFDVEEKDEEGSSNKRLMAYEVPPKFSGCKVSGDKRVFPPCYRNILRYGTLHVNDSSVRR